jgi:hypothetical protein
MIFALLNTKVSDIQCGSFHCIAVGNPRNATAATMAGNNFGGNNINKNKQMVFSWGSNLNK